MPRLILFENVKGFTYPFGKKEDGKAIPYSVIVVNRLRELGYDICPQVIDFSEFGVPQRRKRFILVGVLHGESQGVLWISCMPTARRSCQRMD